MSRKWCSLRKKEMNVSNFMVFILNEKNNIKNDNYEKYEWNK